MFHLFAEVNPASGLSILEANFPRAIFVALGAIPGALSRYYLTRLATQRFGASFPYGTFIINLTGSGLIGFLSTLMTKQLISTDLQALLIIGFLGAYTTFSTYALDTSNLFRTGSRKRALLYWLGSPILGFICVEVGIFFASQML
uniref:Fluoride-specific ion channel FluC n=1 Tax=Oscillatoriales cyanobacterium SpSt-402 TaxID=2282168 RepID=A0A832H9T5_9CYAN